MTRNTAPMRRGFTLIELLVVIAIIVTLAGMITAGVGIANRMIAKTKTTTRIQDLKAGLTNAQTALGHLPGEKEIGSSSGTTDLWKELFKDPGTASFHAPNGSTAVNPDGADPQWETIAAKLRSDLARAGVNLPVEAFQDAWGHPLRYRPAKFYPFKAKAPDVVEIDSETPPAQDTYQLWSSGPDGIDQGGEKGSDDLVSWRN